jgi:hypothetical protein
MDRRLVYAGAALAGFLLVLVASQLIVPAYLEHRAEKRLTEHGGKADVDIDALPAAKLLWHRGKRIEVRGSGIDVPLEGERGRVFDDLDRFGEADVRLDRLTAGPLRIARFTLSRTDREGPYDLAVSASITPRELSGYAGRQLGGALGGMIGQIGSALLPFSTAPIPVELDAVVASNDGDAEVRSVDGTVAGIPADPLVAALAAAIAARL